MKYERDMDTFNRETIVLSIVQKRNEMLEQAQQKGLGAEETVNCSQELDQLMNQLVLLEDVQKIQ